MAAHQITHSGLEALLTPEESVLLLVDHQAFQFANLHSHEPQLVVTTSSPRRRPQSCLTCRQSLRRFWRNVAATSSRDSKTYSPTRSRSTAPSSALGRTSGS